MFTVEHEFDASVVTLVDDGEVPLREDVNIAVFDDCVTVTQYDAHADSDVTITLSLAQARDLGAAFNVPEGSYRLRK